MEEQGINDENCFLLGGVKIPVYIKTPIKRATLSTGTSEKNLFFVLSIYHLSFTNASLAAVRTSSE